MNRNPINCVILGILLTISTARASADIAPDPLTAGRVLQQFGGEKTSVRMVAEDVLVRVFQNEVVTVAEFSMHNEGETVTMEVGFPYFYQGSFLEFRAYVDGREMEVRDGKQENVGRKKSTILWKLWDMTFEEGTSCEIRVEYKTKTYEFEHMFLWTDSYTAMPAGEIERAEELTRTGKVSYYLNSGKAWKGVLDRCRIEFELVGRTDANIEGYGPLDGVLTGRGVVWEYTDYEPVGYVNLRYYPNMAVSDIPSYLLEILEKYPHDPHLASSVGTQLRGDFRDIGLSSEVYHSFLAGWDGRIPQLMEYASGGRCRYDFNGEGGAFYMTWRMAKILLDQYEEQGMPERAADIAPVISKISGAIADSLDTCGNLPKRNARLYEDAVELLQRSNRLIDRGK